MTVHTALQSCLGLGKSVNNLLAFAQSFLGAFKFLVHAAVNLIITEIRSEVGPPDLGQAYEVLPRLVSGSIPNRTGGENPNEKSPQLVNQERKE
jgi:hypothetical protein